MDKISKIKLRSFYSIILLLLLLQLDLPEINNKNLVKIIL